MRQATRLTKLESRAADLPGRRVFDPLEMATMREKIGLRLEAIVANLPEEMPALEELCKVMNER